MKVGAIIMAVCLTTLFVFTDPFHLFGCRHSLEPAIETRSVNGIKYVYNLLTKYASNHEGQFPDTYDMQFLNDCVANGYITEDEIADYRATEAEDGTTGYCLVPHLTQTMRGSKILAITTKPVNNNKFSIVTISGKAECITEDETLDKLIATLENRSWKPRSLKQEK